MSTIVIDGSTEIANFTIVITRGGNYIKEFQFLDDAGTPQALLDAKIVYEPRGAASGEWNSTNGLFTNVSTGVYQLNLDETYTAAITWDAGNWHMYIVEDSGIVVPCVTDGLMFAEDC